MPLMEYDGGNYDVPCANCKKNILRNERRYWDVRKNIYYCANCAAVIRESEKIDTVYRDADILAQIYNKLRKECEGATAEALASMADTIFITRARGK